MPWSKVDKIHRKWIQLYPKLKYVKKMCSLCLEITQWLFLPIPEAQQTFEHKTLFYWRWEVHPFASSVKKTCKNISPSKIYESHVIRQLFWDWLKPMHVLWMLLSVAGWVLLPKLLYNGIVPLAFLMTRIFYSPKLKIKLYLKPI